MKALVFAAGVGSRLKPFTEHHPKALVPVGGKPMLARVIEKIVAAGIREIIVNVHHFADQIIDFVNSNDFGADILISDERDKLLETGGGLVKALEYVGDSPLLIHNADIFTDLSIPAMIACHNHGKQFATLLTADRTTSRKFVFRHDGSLKGWTNIDKGLLKPSDLKIVATDKLRAFDGVHVVSPELYPYIQAYRPRGEAFSITDFYIDMAEKFFISSYDLPAGCCWFDVGKPETLEKACEFLNHSSQHV